MSSVTECPLLAVEVIPIALGSPLDYTSTDSVKEAAILSIITDPFIDISIPETQEPERIFTFRIQGYTYIGYEVTTADITVIVTNCNWGWVT